MSWIARAVEERLAKAAANGELDVAESLKGKPMGDLDRPRSSGWWAEQFVAREKSADRRQEAMREVSSLRVGFWRCTSAEQLRSSVGRANARIDDLNRTLVAADEIARFDADDIVDRWHRLRR